MIPARAPLRNLTISFLKNKQVSNYSQHPRVPLIKFLGKRELRKPHEEHSPRPKIDDVKSSAPKTEQASLSQVPTGAKKGGWAPKPVKPHHPNAVDYFALQNGIMHGRKKFSKEEMEAIELGGAY